jgi:hypothetical protein
MNSSRLYTSSPATGATYQQLGCICSTHAVCHQHASLVNSESATGVFLHHHSQLAAALLPKSKTNTATILAKLPPVCSQGARAGTTPTYW